MARKAQWIDTLALSNIVDGGQALTSMMGGMGTVDSRGLTTSRIIVDLSLSAPVAVSDGLQTVSLGIAVVSQEAFNASVVPDPNLGADRPPRGWLWRTQVVVAGAASMSSAQPLRLMADIRGMRKVDDGELILITNNDSNDGTTFTVRLRGILRTIFLLP